jgi:hypothetical protein
MIGRLSTIAPDLVALLEQQQSEQLRRAAAGVANLAIERTHLSEPRVDAALAALHEGRLGFTPERSAVQYLTEELDKIAWDAQEKMEAGIGSRHAYSTAFRRARAAASLGGALDSNALTAALESVYEAQAAVADLDAVRIIVSGGDSQSGSAGL